ncbi:hypothetical protein OSTOST_09779, partial [Ostertagia ostertagi]
MAAAADGSAQLDPSSTSSSSRPSFMSVNGDDQALCAHRGYVPISAPIPWHRAVGHLARFEMSVVQPPPHLMQFAQTQAALTPVDDDIDLQGGRLIDVVEEEEIDATDGCRVQVITYRIESADGTEQLTKTIRRK